MAQPKWITPASSLGTIPELEYYEFLLDAYDSTGGGLTYTLISGKLPPGLQIIPTGKIQGIPVSELTGDINIEYRFTVRIKNTDNQIADRTFSITITNIAPPIIIPKNVDLGAYFDGTYINTQLQVIEATPSASLTWTVLDGELPLGITMTKDGWLTGYLQAVSAIGPAGDPGWDDTAWDSEVNNVPLSWDFTIDLISKTYTFTIEVSDGVNADQSTYQVVILPREELNGSDIDSITADITALQLGYDFRTGDYNVSELLVSETNKHLPIILTSQADITAIRQDSYYAFQFKVLDLDDDVLKFSIPVSDDSGFDEDFIGFDSTRFSQTLLFVPGSQVVSTTYYIESGSSGTTFRVQDTTGLYPGLLVTTHTGMGGNTTVESIVDSTTLILSQAPTESLIDGTKITIIENSQLSIDQNSGWLTGRLPQSSVNLSTYNFEVLVYKRDYPEYVTRKLFYLSSYGNLNDTIEWVSPVHLGLIENGSISEFSVQAISTMGKRLYYTLTPNQVQRLPQGLRLNSDGLIYGRVSFEIFNLDSGATTLDGGKTLFDNTYEFSVTVSNLDNTLSATQVFSIQVVARNAKPYEDLYLKALPSLTQRFNFLDIMANREIFLPELIYRNNDPYFGLAKDIKFLFLAGLEPSALASYIQGVNTNHFTKRLTFGEIKTAVALDENFNTRYEVVYIEVNDPAANKSGGNAADSIEMSNNNPYYDQDGNAYTTIYPNGFNNMKNSIISNIDYSNKGALPAWMTSNQIDTTGINSFTSPLGMTHGVVLAYTVPGGSNVIAYRLKQASSINFNNIDFTVDRYELDNIYSENYNVADKKYIKSYETTFDRYRINDSMFSDQGGVDYALSVPFDSIHQNTVDQIRAAGGMDGILEFNDGEYIVFAKQQFIQTAIQANQTIIIDNYNYGWSNIMRSWDFDPFAYNADTNDSDTLDPSVDLTPGEPWNETNYVPGFIEHVNYSAVNKRASVWKINISNNNIVTLTYVKSITYFDKIQVRSGYTYGSTTIFFDPALKPGKEVPEYTLIQNQITPNVTTFDGNGTKFLSNRDLAVVPEEGAKYIKFTKFGVFT